MENASNERLFKSFTNLTNQLITGDMELGMQIKGRIPSRVEKQYDLIMRAGPTTLAV